MKHGGDLLSYKNEYKGDIIDFSSNINPLGYPEGLKEEIFENFKEIDKYPDIKYRNLKTSVSKYLKCNEENVVLGNGSMEIIDHSLYFKDRVLLFYPCFGEYEDRAKVNNKEIIKIPLDKEFKIDLEVFKKNLKDNTIVILGNPNNPTGLRIEKETLLSIYKEIKSKNSLLVLDEAFFEFSPEDYDSIELFKNENYENVLIIRAATKVYGIPGLRLGYGCTNENLVQKISENQLPWSINTLADLAGRWILSEEEFLIKSKNYLNKEREFLLKELNSINGIRPFNTHSNFILIKLDKLNGEYILKNLISRGILIRTCTSFEGLDDSFIRVAIKDRNNNLELIKGLKDIYGEI